MVSNKQLSARERVSIQFLRECFEYREGVLYWTERPAHHFRRPADHATFIKKSAGKPAGRKEPKGYICVKFRNGGHGVTLSAHHIVWALHHGRWPTLHIDHINRVRNDNRIENLREVTPAENAQNSSWKRVHPYVHPSRKGQFAAQVKVGDQQIHIGVFPSERAAHEYRQAVLDELAKVARALAKKSKIGRPRKDADTISPRGTHGDGNV